MKVPVYSQNGEEMGEALLPKEIFDVKINPDLVYQASVIQAANRRQVIASTKTRGDVRGGGKKPWKQKGTGRARVGSSRSPLWRGGGTVFGPNKEKVFKRKLNKKTAKSALFMVLSSKVRDKEFIFLDDLKIEKPKTKLMAGIIENLKSKIEAFKKGTVLILLPAKEEMIFKASRNIAKIDVMEARNLNALDLLNHKYLLATKESVKAIKDTFLK
ncbi:MAG: 50S ribosomal protein L4 [bacterium]|nr:50S ribosomal protein L4 [bacterium]